MLVKAILFITIGCVSAALVLAKDHSLATITLLALMIWAFCRAYYFAFYVITNYIDGSYCYSGIVSAIIFLIRGK